jgi:hypothetical protein
MNVGVKICEMCKNEFEINLNNKRSYNKRFCSITCARKYNGLNNKGRNHTDEWKKELSKRNCGEGNPFFNKSHSEDSKKKMSESSFWTEDKFKYCNMSEKEKEIFEGIMISDGSLSKSRISARLTLGFKYKQTLERIQQDLKSISFLDIWEYSWVDKRTKNTYTNYYTKSNSFRNLLFEFDRWYKNNIKIIPVDFRLTSLTCYWWYICDGYISNDNVYLCTDSFDDSYVKDISNKINDIGFINRVTNRNRIRFYKKDSINFLKWISNDLEIQNEYIYKWSLKNN